MTGGPQAAPRLRMLFWESTCRCNLACVHCRRLDASDASGEDLTTDEVRAVFDSWDKASPGSQVQKHAIVRLRETLHRVENMGKSWVGALDKMWLVGDPCRVLEGFCGSVPVGQPTRADSVEEGVWSCSRGATRRLSS